MNQLKQIHANTLRNGINFSNFLIQKLLEIPNIPYARKVFDQIPQPNISLYNKLIQAYSFHGPQHLTLSLYTHLLSSGRAPSQYTYTSLFAACSSLPSRYGKTLHSRFVKSGFEYDVFALTALLDMYAKTGQLGSARKLFEEMEFRDIPAWNSLVAGYAKCGEMEKAVQVFKEMSERNVVSWTAIISGYSQNGHYAKAIEMFLKMERESGVRPNEVTIASVLPACANLGALEIGQRIARYARVKGYLNNNIYVCNAVLEMYSRCGRIDIAKKMFDNIGIKRNVCSWNTMIMGFALHGKCNEALQLFQHMQRENIAPDDVTFVGILVACTHGGMVKTGRDIFNSMELKFSIVPKLEHYGCIVDLLGRAGELNEAYNLIKSMPIKPDSVIWGTLLGACSFHGHVELAEIAAESLFELEPCNPGNYVIMSNIYASNRKWSGVSKMRKFMKGEVITKAAGYSFIEYGGRVHKFIVEDRSHPMSLEIYSMLENISSILKLSREAKELNSDVDELCFVT